MNGCVIYGQPPSYSVLGLGALFYELDAFHYGDIATPLFQQLLSALRITNERSSDQNNVLIDRTTGMYSCKNVTRPRKADENEPRPLLRGKDRKGCDAPQ